MLVRSNGYRVGQMRLHRRCILRDCCQPIVVVSACRICRRLMLPQEGDTDMYTLCNTISTHSNSGDPALWACS